MSSFRYLTCCLLILASLVKAPLLYAEDFNLRLERLSSLANQGVKGRLLLNNQELGITLENANTLIPIGSYTGIMRYASSKGFAQSANGQLSNTGDFLLEIAGVPGFTDILFHTGTQPHHSRGCILLGPAYRDDKGIGHLPEDHPLRKLRNYFYGSNQPNSSPITKINITII
ncbi:MAG: hypothetical protein COA42_14980 [Alteromonadaceae bacterium]|nr:MAG: hypothetical protein COA42_14980 [Alteromonadaceae bacterium]